MRLLVVAGLTDMDIVFIISTITAMPIGHVKTLWGKLQNIQIYRTVVTYFVHVHHMLFCSISLAVLVWPDQVLRISFTALDSSRNFLPESHESNIACC